MARRSVGTALLLCALALSRGVSAADGVTASLEDRAKGSERVVVATVQSATPTYESNNYGDRLIVSHLSLVVEETMKGPAQNAAAVDVLGGTIDGVTLRVSSLPAMATGDRAVFFLERTPSGRLIPHFKGQGILKLDSSDRIKGTEITLQDIRNAVARSAAAGGGR